MSAPSSPPGPLFLVVAGEASGDLHGARVIEALRTRTPDARFVGMGGPLMQAAGLRPLYDARDISVMGFVEVLPKLFRILSILRGLARAARELRPVAAILCDLPDFNLRLAKKLKQVGIPVTCYIAPMAWAWRPSRVKTLRRFVDRLLVIYPFEQPWFRARGVDAEYVGNPLLEEGHLASPPSRAAAREALQLKPDDQVIALLPGSRRNEILRVLPSMLAGVALLRAKEPSLRFVLPIAPSLERALVEALVQAANVPVQLVDGRAPEVLAACDTALVCSGTATLETALCERPMVVVFRANPLSLWLARKLVRIPWAALPNVLSERFIVPELLGGDCTPEAIARELAAILHDGPARRAQLQALSSLRAQLGGPGASAKVAARVLELAKLLPASTERAS